MNNFDIPTYVSGFYIIILYSSGVLQLDKRFIPFQETARKLPLTLIGLFLNIPLSMYYLGIKCDLGSKYSM